MREAFIVSAARTPVGRAGGVLSTVRADDLAALAVRAAVDRASVDPAAIDDVVLGCANQAGEDNRNVARMAALLAGLPVEVPGQTVNRLCGSGLQAVIAATHAVRAEEGDVLVAGGVESMTRAPFVMLKSPAPWSREAPQLADSTVGWRFVNPRMNAEWTIALGATAERVAQIHGITRDDQDRFALESQHRAACAQRDGVFNDEMIPVPIATRDGSGIVDRDEYPRPDTTIDTLARLKPAFVESGTVTAGTTSGVNDGASALTIVSEAMLDGRRPLARIVATAVAGVDPAVMGLGPIPATRKALQRAGINASRLDLIELNEAFASQAIACIRTLDLDPARVNVYGGAIALGHALGSSGSRMLVTLVHALRRRGGQYGLATMCVGVGQGVAVIIESV